MLPKKRLSSYCSEDFSLIENYEKAINDTTQVWDCHHRLETDLGLSKKQLKDNNLYYNRPASELILLTHAEHSSLHNKYGNGFKSYKPMERTKEWCENISKSHMGSKNPMSRFNVTWMVRNNDEEIVVKLENVEQFKQNGWEIGRIKGRKSWTKGKKIGRWMIKNNIPTFVKLSEIQSYLNNGYIFGRKTH